jgi:hypothetical protein
VPSVPPTPRRSTESADTTAPRLTTTHRDVTMVVPRSAGWSAVLLAVAVDLMWRGVVGSDALRHDAFQGECTPDKSDTSRAVSRGEWW